MGDAGEVWRAVREKDRREKQKRGDRNMQQLKDAIYADSRISMFDTGHGYIITFQRRRVQYWPQTGATMPRFGKDRSRRTFSGNELIAFITSK